MATRRMAIVAVLALSAALLAACGGAGPDAGGTSAGVGGPPAGDPAAPPAGDPVQPPPGDPGQPPPGDPGQPPADPAPAPGAGTMDPPATGDWVLRESFGLGEGNLRKAGGRGDLRSTLVRDLDGFWVEFPDSGAAWAAAPEAWQLAACSPDPLEPASPLGDGCAVSPWTDAVAYPDALVPFDAPAGGYVISADLYPSALAGAYVAIGLTSSAALADNLRTSGQLWLLFRYVQPGDGIHGEWELRAGGGTVLAQGSMIFSGYTPVALGYDGAGAAFVTVGGATVGPFAAAGVAPRFLALEGQGVLDNLQVRPVL